MPPTPKDDLAAEQAQLDRLYSRLDELRTECAAELEDVLLGGAGESGALVDRDVRAAHLTGRAAKLEAAENGLCFGRLDLRDGTTRYIGRVGLRSAPPEREPLLLDWRAPGARAFYVATPRAPLGVTRRRHLRTQGRSVVRVSDELLDLDAGDLLELQGEGALMAALGAQRTGRMHDVVETLQREQDDIVRAPHDGVLVVQGGPGTGKTAVALHRAAYLLYSAPEIARRGVLVVGPTTAFLDYIGQVLPSLGETAVVLATTGILYPGVVADRPETPEAEAVKGDLAMAGVLASAVRDRQGADDDVTVTFEGETYTLPAASIASAVMEARQTGLPHNLARREFRRQILGELSWQVVDANLRLLDEVESGLEDELAAVDAALARSEDAVPARVQHQGSEVDGLLGAHEREHLERELVADPGVAAALEELWPQLTPEQLLDDLLADRDRMRRAGLPAEAQLVLRRPPGQGWSVADVPLLDEAAELLGVDDTELAASEARRRLESLRFARQVLAQADLLGDGEALLSASELASRHEEADTRPLAERAAADRTWAYGHVVVDEAQELSPMAWRAVFRRCPSRSMTVVGDLDQGSVQAATSWEAALNPHAGAHWRQARLTVSYRTPRAVMAAAVPLLKAVDPGTRPPISARDGGTVWRRETGTALVSAVVDAVSAEVAEGGKVAVVAPGELVGVLGSALAGAHATTSWGDGLDLAADVVVLTANQARGLEFDSVVVADPAEILDGPRGLNALYVAMTRATQRLGVVHPGEVPEVLRHLPVG